MKAIWTIPWKQRHKNSWAKPVVRSHHHNNRKERHNQQVCETKSSEWDYLNKHDQSEEKTPGSTSNKSSSHRATIVDSDSHDSAFFKNRCYHRESREPHASFRFKRIIIMPVHAVHALSNRSRLDAATPTAQTLNWYCQRYGNTNFTKGLKVFWFNALIESYFNTIGEWCVLVSNNKGWT